MYTRHHPILTAATFIFILSALPVKADHCGQTANDLQNKHNLKHATENKHPCIHKRNNQQIVPNTSMDQLSSEGSRPNFSAELPLVSH